jgi:hypothetical protein
LEVDDEGLSIEDREEYLQVVQSDLLWVIVHANVHLLPRVKGSFSRIDLEDFVLKYMPFESLLITWFSWISPRLQLNFLVIWHFEAPVSSYSTNIL